MQNACTPFELPGLDSRYTILDLLDRGGMGIVYKAHDRVLDRVVAIKTIKTARLEQKQLVAFQTEAKAISSLTHEAIVRVLDFGIMKQGQPFLVLDYIEGETLAQRISKKGRLPLRLALQIIADVCVAIAHAHDHGVIHRDLKSSNIMLVKNGNELNAQVIDFGIAVVLENPSRGVTLTPSGSIVGSPAYMSPEQITQSRLDVRTDIYSLGCVMYEAITGHRPFRGDSSLEIMHKHINDTPPRLSSKVCDPELRPLLNAIVFKTLKKDPSRRYQSIEELHDDIAVLLESVEELDRTNADVPQEDQFDARIKQCQKDSQIIRLNAQRRKSGLIAFAFLLTVLLGIGTIASTMFYFEEGNSPAKIDEPSQEQKESAEQDEMNDFLLKSADRAWTNHDPRIFTRDLNDISINKTELNLSYYDLSKVDLTPLLRLNNLRELKLVNCNLPSKSLKTISRLPNLHTLAVSENKKFSVEDVRLLSNIKTLRAIDFDRCYLSDEHFETLSACKNLRYINLSWNRVTPHTLNLLAEMKHIQFLSLNGCGIKSQDLAILSRLQEIYALKIDCANLNDENLKPLRKFTNLKILSASFTGITEKGIDDLAAHLPKLVELKVVGTKYKEEGIEPLMHKYPRLRIIDDAGLQGF